MKKFTKMMGIILTLAMLVSAVAMPGCVIADEETASIVLSSNTGNLVVPSGTNAKVTATVADADNASKIEFYENDILVSTITDLDGELSCKVTAPEGRKYVYAKLVDAENNTIATSETVFVTGYKQAVTDSMWDIDFEDEYFHTLADYPEYRYLYGTDGTALTQTRFGAKSTLTAHTGDTSNNMTIEASGDEAHGNAIKMTTATVSQNQFNEFRARNGGVLVGQWDYKFAVIPPMTEGMAVKMIEPNIAPDLGGSKEVLAPIIAMKYRGETPWILWTDGVENDVPDVFYEAVEADKWYNLKTYTDFNNGTIQYFVNNDFITEYKFDCKTYVCMEKYRTSLYYAPGAEIWIDNFKVEGVSLTNIAPDVKLTDGTNGRDVLAGSKVRLGITPSNGDDFAEYKLFTSVDGKTFSYNSSIDASLPYITVTASEWPTSYIIKAYDADGGLLAFSDAVTVSGKKAQRNGTIWNLNFEDESFCIVSNGLNRYPSTDGVNYLKSNGDTIGMHVGDEDNTITIENTASVEGGKNGRSLAFTRNGNAGNCQINNGWAKLSSGLLIYSVDVATDSYGTRTLLTGAAAKAAGKNQWMPMVEMRADGNIAAYLRSQTAALVAPGADTVVYDTLNYIYIGKYEPNKWYNVKFVMDIEGGTLDIYFDDEYVATDMDRVSTTMTPARFTLSNGVSDGTLYVDNISAYRVAYETPDFALNSVNYAINGEAANAISDGKLTATVNLTNNGEVCEKICYVAVYDGTRLARLYPTAVKFAKGETHKRIFVDAGNVTSGMAVKTLLWNTDNITPVCVADELK